jgi:hypothetical protein
VEEGSEGSAYRLRELVEILEGCLEEDPVKRWKGDALYVGIVGWALCRKFLSVALCYSHFAH